MQKINTWKASKKPVHFIATACGVDLYCSIEKFNYSEEGGDPGTYQYDITLKEYREITVRQVKVDIPSKEATVEKEEARVDNSVQPKTYTVKSGFLLAFHVLIFCTSSSGFVMLLTCNPGKRAAGKKLEKLNCRAGRLCMMMISPSPVMSMLSLLLPLLVLNVSGRTGSCIFSFSALYVSHI